MTQLKAIDDLKEKLAKGEKLEATQVQKIKRSVALLQSPARMFDRSLRLTCYLGVDPSFPSDLLCSRSSQRGRHPARARCAREVSGDRMKKGARWALASGCDSFVDLAMSLPLPPSSTTTAKESRQSEG
jgi:hypothetical protein